MSADASQLDQALAFAWLSSRDVTPSVLHRAVQSLTDGDAPRVGDRVLVTPSAVGSITRRRVASYRGELEHAERGLAWVRPEDGGEGAPLVVLPLSCVRRADGAVQ